MSHFGLSMGDFEDDPFFGAHMQRMNNMMNSMFDPFGMMGGPAAIMGNQHMGNQQRQLQMPGMQMMPFGFPSMGMNINRMISDLQNINGNPNCHSYSSSSVMTMTTGPDGRPQVYQESMSSRTGPGGIKETKQTVSDSRTGTRKMAIGHHIGERAHIIEREKNEYTGDQEERQDFINLDEEEADTFNQEWQRKTRRSMPAISNGYSRHHNDRLALPSTVPSLSRIVAAPKRKIKNALSSKKNKNKDSSRSAESTSTSTSNSTNTSSSSSTAILSLESPQDLSSTSCSRPTDNTNYNSSSSNSTGRKREHSPEIEEIENPNHKRRSHGTTSDD